MSEVGEPNDGRNATGAVGPAVRVAAQVLDRAGRAGLLARFDTFFDAVLDWVAVDGDGELARARLQLVAWDRSAPSRRTAVLLEVSGVVGAVLARPDQLVVQSFGVQFVWRDGWVHLFLNSLYEDPDQWPRAEDIVGHLQGTACAWRAAPVPLGEDGQPATSGAWSPPWARPVARDAVGQRRWEVAVDGADFRPALGPLGRLRRVSVEFDRGDAVGIKPATTLILDLTLESDPSIPAATVGWVTEVVSVEIEGGIGFSVRLDLSTSPVVFDLLAQGMVEKAPFGRLPQVEGRWGPLPGEADADRGHLAAIGHRVRWRRWRELLA